MVRCDYIFGFLFIKFGFIPTATAVSLSEGAGTDRRELYARKLTEYFLL